jgi:hypothetical protein
MIPGGTIQALQFCTHFTFSDFLGIRYLRPICTNNTDNSPNRENDRSKDPNQHKVLPIPLQPELGQRSQPIEQNYLSEYCQEGQVVRFIDNSLQGSYTRYSPAEKCLKPAPPNHRHHVLKHPGHHCKYTTEHPGEACHQNLKFFTKKMIRP